MLGYVSAPIRGIFHRCSRCKKKRSSQKQCYRSLHGETYKWLCNECVKVLSEKEVVVTLNIKDFSISIN